MSGNCPLRSLRSPQRALPAGINVEAGTSQSKSGTSVDLSNSGESRHERDGESGARVPAEGACSLQSGNKSLSVGTSLCPDGCDSGLSGERRDLGNEVERDAESRGVIQREMHHLLVLFFITLQPRA